MSKRYFISGKGKVRSALLWKKHQSLIFFGKQFVRRCIKKKENGATRGREIVVGMHRTHVGHLESTGEIVEVWWTWVNDPDRNS